MPAEELSDDIGGWLRWAQQQLQDCSSSPRLDAEVLLCHCLGVSRSHLYTWPERPLPAAAAAHCRALIERRRGGEPVAYLLGEQEFWSLPLKVTADTLIPRPETELLVEQALQRLSANRPSRVLDLGTGSGAIALAIASERPRARVIGVDRSAAALAVASENRQRLGLDHVELRQGDWYQPVAAERFDLIAANPPYIGADEPEPHQGDCRFEPRSALIAPEHGLGDLRRIIAEAPQHLLPGGHLLLEHGYRQGPAVRELLLAAGFAEVTTVADLQGHERVSLGRRA